jgi:hypothetical protein
VTFLVARIGDPRLLFFSISMEISIPVRESALGLYRCGSIPRGLLR